MTIQGILEAHRTLSVSHLTPAHKLCKCGQLFNDRPSHRAHVAEVLEKHMQEREAVAFKAGFDNAHNQHTAHQARRNQPYPTLVYVNPYAGKDSTNGR